MQEMISIQSYTFQGTDVPQDYLKGVKIHFHILILFFLVQVVGALLVS